MAKTFIARGVAAAMISTAVLAWTTATAAQAPVTFHVSPQGDDRNPGSADRPVRSLPRAQALVRAHNLKSDVTVEIAAGEYRLDRPLVFTASDGGQGDHRVVWRGEAGSRPLISGGFDVTGFKLLDAERRIYVADIPKGLDMRQVWVNDILAERPWIEIKPSDVKFNATGFEIVNPDLAFLSTLKHPARLEVEATGFFTDRVSPVAAIDGARVTMRQPAWDNNTWGYDTLSQPIFPEDSRLFVVNAPELIGKTNDWHAKPYQWFVDPSAGKLYLRIAEDDDIAKLRVTVPALPVLASISGTPRAPVRNMTFQGLRFSYTSWMGPSEPSGYANQQSGAFLKDISPIRPADAWSKCGWGCPEFESMRQKWSQMPAAVQVAAARDIVFQDNQFSQLGQIGLGVGNDPSANLSGAGLATRGVRISRNLFAVLSGGAIMAGGVREDAHHPSTPELINADLEIADNTVATVSQDYKDNAAILTTYIDGARILHNEISDAPYDGVAVGWGWGYNDAGGNPNYDENQQGYLHNPRYTTPTTLRNTLIEGNRIHGVKTWYMDGGAIYNLSANPGAVIRGNHIFDIDGKIAIYLDEGSKHFRVTGNVVDTQGKWLNVNTAGKMYRRKISTDNTATGNWHSSTRTGGRWLAEIGNVAEGNILVPTRDWPAEARAVINEAGPRPVSETAR
ncbi:RICIN domain-containing protein [soil metagenome]